MLCILLITYRQPCLASLVETRDGEYVWKAYNALLPWGHLLLIRRGLVRARSMMEKLGLGAELPIASRSRSTVHPDEGNLT